MGIREELFKYLKSIKDKMDSKYIRAIAALNTAATLAKNSETQEQAVLFMQKNKSYFPNLHLPNIVVKDTGKAESLDVPVFVPLNSKNKSL